MLKQLIIGATATMLLVAPALAQVRSEVELTRQQIQTDRQAIVSASLPLTDQQAAAFWPLYRDYRTALNPIGDRQVTLIAEFAEKFQAMTDADSERMLRAMFAIKRDQLDVQQKFADRFKKVLPSVLVGRFYQIENKLDAIIMFDLASRIPLAGR